MGRCRVVLVLAVTARTSLRSASWGSCRKPVTNGHPLPPSSGARVSFKGGKPTVTDGPFPEVKEVLGGYWMIEVRSREEAIEWARRCPASKNDVIEIRRVQEMSDFPADIQKAAEGLGELQGR
jgi:YCII-related domain